MAELMSIELLVPGGMLYTCTDTPEEVGKWLYRTMSRYVAEPMYRGTRPSIKVSVIC